MKIRSMAALMVVVAASAVLLAQNRVKVAKSLEERVVDLEARIQVLEVRVGGLGQQPLSSDQWRHLALWRTRLSKGMTKKEVIDLLGEPTKITVFSDNETWYYGYPLGGSVELSSRGTVYSWSEPPPR